MSEQRDRVLDAANGNPEYVAQLLGQIEAQCRIAREALADEHEGNFTRAALFIEADAGDLGTLVRSW